MRLKLAAFRPENLLPRSKELAAQYGFDFFGFPLFDLVEREEALSEITTALQEGVDILVFTSVNGVRKAFELCEGEIDLRERILEVGAKLCAIGPVTREELQKRGLRVTLMPTIYSTSGLRELFSELKVRDRRIVFIRSAEGNKEIICFLEEKGALVKDIVIYQPRKKAITEFKNLFEALVRYKPDYILFTSSLTFEIFFELSHELKREEEVFGGTKIVAIGDVTAEAIAKKGLNVDLVAEKGTFESLLNEIKTYELLHRNPLPV